MVNILLAQRSSHMNLMASWKETKKGFFKELVNITGPHNASDRYALPSAPFPHKGRDSRNASECLIGTDPTCTSSPGESSVHAPHTATPPPKHQRSPFRPQVLYTDDSSPPLRSSTSHRSPDRSRDSSPCTTSSSPASPPNILPTTRLPI